MAIQNVDLDLLKFMSNRDTYYKYRYSVNKGLCTKESWNLIVDFGKYFEQYPGEPAIKDDFPIWLRVTGRPGWKQDQLDIYATIVQNVLKRPTPDNKIILQQLETLRFQTAADEAMQQLRAGKIQPDKLVDELIKELHTQAFTPKENTLQDIDLEHLANAQRDHQGLYWRLEDLNKSVGPVRKGDFIVIGKRPEVGGTSFLVSEMTHMLEQLPKGAKVALFNNEEEPSKVSTRIISAALGIDYRQLMAAPKHWKQQYDKWLDGREFHLHHMTGMDLNMVRRTLNETKYDVVGINVILKVKGNNSTTKEDHDKLQDLGTEFRNLAQQHAPVLGIAQADPSAEGMRYIPQDRLYKSKTALQGEADVQIMIGSDDDNAGPSARFIFVAKNKIPPAPCTEDDKKHIKAEVKFDIGTGRFTSVNYTGNSRYIK